MKGTNSYDPIAEINTLRMNGYVVTSGLGSFIVNQRFYVNPTKMTIVDTHDIDKSKRFNMGKKHK